MAEYEVYVELEGDVDVDVYFSDYTFKEILIILWKVIRGQKVTFEEMPVELGGDTYVEIDRY